MHPKLIYLSHLSNCLSGQVAIGELRVIEANCVIDVVVHVQLRQYCIRHLGRALVPWVPLWSPPPSLRGWRTSKVVFLCHHLIVLVN